MKKRCGAFKKTYMLYKENSVGLIFVKTKETISQVEYELFWKTGHYIYL